MYEIGKKDLEALVNKAVLSPENHELNVGVQKVLVEVLGALCDSVSQKMNATVDDAFSSARKNQEIVVALLGKDDNLEHIGLHNMLLPGGSAEVNRELWANTSQGRVDFGTIFLEEDYETLREVVGDNTSAKKFKGTYQDLGTGQSGEFEYTLRFDTQYIEMHEEIMRLSLYYSSLDNPILYSPYSRKSFWLNFDRTLLDPNKYIINFRFPENNLHVSLGKRLCWNFKLEQKPAQVYANKIPFGEEIKYHFVFPKSKKGHYYYALPCNNQTRVYDAVFTENGTEITVSKDKEDFLLFEPFDVDFDLQEIKSLQVDQVIFCNGHPNRTVPLGRINSRGDIEHAISPFRKDPKVTCELVPKVDSPFLRYSSKYGRNQGNRNAFHKLTTQPIIFKPIQEPIKFLGDYVNYVLDYLDFYYPEIDWVGGKECLISGKNTL